MKTSGAQTAPMGGFAGAWAFLPADLFRKK